MAASQFDYYLMCLLHEDHVDHPVGFNRDDSVKTFFSREKQQRQTMRKQHLKGIDVVDATMSIPFGDPLGNEFVLDINSDEKMFEVLKDAMNNFDDAICLPFVKCIY